MATGSKAFLLVLLLATVTCILVLQVSLDGWLLNGGLNFHQFNLIEPKKDGEETAVSGAQGSALNTTGITSLGSSPLHEEHRSTIRTTISQKNFTAPPPSPLKTSLPLKTNSSFVQTKSTSKPSQQVQAKVRVRQLQVSKLEQPSRGENPNLLVDRQTKLAEILKQSDAAHIVPRAIKAIQVMPTVKSEKVLRVFLITYFRSGSSFVGELLQQNWKTFYQFEPLHYMTYDRRISDVRAKEAFDLFSSIYHCNFTNLDNYFNWARRQRNQFLFARSLFLWFSCRTKPRMCFHPDFVSAVCKRAPVQVVKVTRVHMRQLKMFLQESRDLDIKVVFLSRDPRGIVSSRLSLDWCNGTDCSDPRVLCNEMKDDLAVFDELQKAEPSKFIQVRYEDLALHPKEEAIRLFNFLHLPFSPSVQRFLKSHTIARKTDNLDPYSTRRNSSSMAFSWRQRFTFDQVKSVQSSCSDVIKKLNFSLITSPNELDHPSRSIVAHIANKSHFNSSVNVTTSKAEVHTNISYPRNVELPNSSLTKGERNTANVHHSKFWTPSPTDVHGEKNRVYSPLINGLETNSIAKKLTLKNLTHIER